MAQFTGSLNISGSIDASAITGSLDWGQLGNIPEGIMSSSTGFIEASQTASMTVASASVADTASYIEAGNIDGDVTNSQNIYVNNYASYDGNQRIAFVGGVNQYHPLRADTEFNFNPGQNKLSVPNIDATTLTGSLDWDQLENVPDGIMSSSNGIVPDGTISSSTQVVAALPDGTISGSDQVNLTGLDGDDLKFNTRAICAVFGGTSLGNAYSESRGNVAVGYCAFRGVSTPADLEQNTALGLCAGYNVNSDSLNNVFIGHGAAGCNTNCHNSNIAIGPAAMRCGGGAYNIALGGVAGEDMTGDYNIVLGSLAARDPFTGDSNIVIGALAGRCLSGAAGYNILIGYNAGATPYFPKAAYNTSQSGSVVAIQAGNGTEPNIHGRFNSWGGVKDYFQINAPVTASSFEAASLTGSLNWSDLDDVPSGIVSGSISFSDLTNVPTGIPSESSAVMHLNVMDGYQETGSVIFGRNDNIGRFHEIRGYNTNTAANNYLAFRIHNGTVDETVEVLRLTGNGEVSGSFIGDGSSLTGITADSVDTASYVSGSDVDGEVYEAERARRIEVGSYGSYSQLTDIPFITGDYGSSIKRISADGALQWHAGTEHLTVPGVDTTSITSSIISGSSITASIDAQYIDNLPVSSSNPVTPVLHIPNGSTDRKIVAIGNDILTHAISASNLPYGTVVVGDGAAAGLNAGILGSDNVVIGRDAMSGINDEQIDGCLNLGVVIGYKAAANSSGTENITIGGQSFTSGSGHSNTVIGTWAGNGYGFTGDSNVLIGHQAGGSDAAGVGICGDSCRNTIIGASATVKDGCSNVLIGFGAGSNTNFSNKLYIENGGSTPLIEGDFNTGLVQINDVLKLNESNPLPTGDVGQLAVSASNLYFHNGTSWSQIN